MLVSEVMLQQTQVQRVVPAWHAFLGRFPTVTACADAAQAEVVRAWSGLGYNRRAVNLHRIAKTVVDRHGGVLPSDLEELEAMPGVGSYTARAVRAFAFELDAAVIDTNAARVLARTSGRRLRPREAQALADELVPQGRSWQWNQTMLDFGATVCTRRAPACDHCPLRAGACTWARAGFPDPDPADGSAGVPGRQSRFEGSDRQGRGRLVEAMRSGPVEATSHSLAAAMGWPNDPERADRVAATLVRDGIALVAGDYFVLG
ncbi:MAG TPA: A/G-specific adenine glycosylase [Acidimicrobiales bacterium]|nr:A/G-specific adenine glycosylase [Acidimicrobiales bacterium]